MPRCAAFFRKPVFSPHQHLQNDTAILDATLAELARAGWDTLRVPETHLEHSPPPEADLYLNMCQGAEALEALLPLERRGVRIVNPPSSALNCHRHRLVPLLADGTVAFPETVLISTASPNVAVLPPAVLASTGESFWLKRGDVHATRTEDVVRITAGDLPSARAGFAGRGIERAALQRHVPGPVVKFYGVADTEFFRFYDSSAGPGGLLPPVDGAALERLARRAAARLGLEVFGGDIVVQSPDEPVLIDMNDWPSFAPFRQAAAEAIAELILQPTERGSLP